MEKKIEIIVIEDDPAELNGLINEIDRHDNDFRLVYASGNATQAFEKLMETCADAVILDLELHQGGGDGIDFLKKVREAALPRPPYILVATNNISRITHDAARSLGADYILTKCQQGYSAATPVNHILECKSIILGRKSVNNMPVVNTESSEYRKKRIKRIIYDNLDMVGISPKNIGYDYLAEAILLVIDGKTENIKETIGKQFNKTSDSVERAMQNAINRAWTIVDATDLYKFYTAKISSAKGVPTLMEFVYYFSSKIKLEI